MCPGLFLQVRGLPRTVQVVERGPALALVVVSVVVKRCRDGFCTPR